MVLRSGRVESDVLLPSSVSSLLDGESQRQRHLPLLGASVLPCRPWAIPVTGQVQREARGAGRMSLITLLPTDSTGPAPFVATFAIRHGEETTVDDNTEWNRRAKLFVTWPVNRAGGQHHVGVLDSDHNRSPIKWRYM